MKKILIVLIMLIGLVSCQNNQELSPKKERAKKLFSKAVGEGVAYNVFSTDASFAYTEQFTKIMIDSSDDYALKYAQSFRYLTNKRKIPTENAVKKEVDNPFIILMKD